MPQMARILSPFKPTKLPPCGLWLEADRGITLDGSNLVSAMADQSGNARHAAQTDPTKRMQYLPTGFNGHPCLQGAAGKSLNNTDMGIAAGLTGATFCVVFQASSLNKTQIVCEGNNRRLSVQMGGDGKIYIHTNTLPSAFGGTPFTSLAPTILVAKYDGTQTGNAARLRLSLNGIQQTLTFTGTVSDALGAITSYRVGGSFLSETLYFFTGKIPVPGIMYPWVFSNEQEQQFTRAYGSKYGITVA